MATVDRNELAHRKERFTEICRQKGLKITPQRFEIYRELASSTAHPSAEDIYRRIRKRMPTVSLDTVYRTLTTFKENGLISRVEVFDDPARFDANIDHHHHFICTECRRVVDIDWPEFDSLKLPEEIGNLGRVNQPHAELHGICSECLSKKKN
jgi:Fur family peroxide stress response transcriptional regulator